MAITGIPPPRQFFFRCTNRTCRTYQVSEESFRKCLTPKTEAQVAEAFKAGAVDAILDFGDDCPQCNPRQVYTARVITRHKRIN